MSINLKVQGKPDSIHACEQSMSGVSKAITGGADDINSARSNSSSEWEGSAGDAFRERASGMVSSADAISKGASDAASAIGTLGYSLTAVKNQMQQAADHAAHAGLTVTYGPQGPETIEPPQPDAAGTMSNTMKSAVQWGAYNDAADIVADARDKEAAAHALLIDSLSAVRETLHDQETNHAWAFSVGGAVTGYVAAAVDKYDQFTEKANDYYANAESLGRDLEAALERGDPYEISLSKKLVDDAIAKGKSAEDAADSVSKMLLGQADNPVVQEVGRWLGASPGDYAPEESVLEKAGKSVPYVGGGIAAVQTFVDVSNAKTLGEKAKAAGSDMGSFVAGSAATELLMGSAVAGPAGVGAVAIGIGVALATSEAINHWGSVEKIGNDIADLF